jgi:hypothetical protein
MRIFDLIVLALVFLFFPTLVWAAVAGAFTGWFIAQVRMAIERHRLGL